MDVFLTLPCNVSAPCPTRIHQVIIQHHDVLITYFNLAWKSPEKKTLMPLFTCGHFSFCLRLLRTVISPSLSPSERPPVSSFLSLLFLSHLIPTQSKHRTIWKIKCRLALPPHLPSFSVSPPYSPTCLLVQPEGIVGFKVTGEVGWLNIKLSRELTLLLCPALNASLLLKFPLHPMPPSLYPVNPEGIDTAGHSTLPGRGHQRSFSSISFICRDKRGIEGPAKFIDCWQWGCLIVRDLKVTRKVQETSGRLRCREKKVKTGQTPQGFCRYNHLWCQCFKL